MASFDIGQLVRSQTGAQGIIVSVRQDADKRWVFYVDFSDGAQIPCYSANLELIHG